MAVLNTAIHQYEVIDNVIRTGYGSEGVMINGEFHVIGGWNNDEHLKWNEETKKFDQICDLTQEIIV